MDAQQIYEIIGYVASILIAVSLMMRSILRLRTINLIGSAFFTIYGLTIRAYPVAVVNFFIVLIDLYYLYQMLSTREFFRLLEVRPESDYLRYFLNFYEKDIRQFQPDFQFDPAANQLVFFILRNLVPAGLLIGEVRNGEDLHVRLDYAIPGYRDLKIGRFLYQDHSQDFLSRGIRNIFTDPGAPKHAQYLQQMGFQAQTDGSYRLSLQEG